MKQVGNYFGGHKRFFGVHAKERIHVAGIKINPYIIC